MKLYLIQHGKPNPEEVDPEKNLSEQGKADVQKLAQFLKNAGISVADIFHSGKARAEQTAEIFASALGKTAQQKNGLMPMDEVKAIANELEALNQDIMLVGHMPFMNRLTSLLLSGNDNADLVQFQQGGVVMIEKTEGKWRVAGMLVPEMLS